MAELRRELVRVSSVLLSGVVAWLVMDAAFGISFAFLGLMAILIPWE